ncbi:LOW QUALITY PROTEIN: uncharacterized protein ACN427_012882, partial [Glossina fuscipes fuscipes]
IKEKLLTYLDTVLGIEEQISGRAFDDDVIEKVIEDRVARILNTNEIRVLPETLFAGLPNSVLSYRVDRGFDLEIPQNKARRDKKKNKLFLPLLLLMKFKLKIIMPMLMSLIGLKVLISSKIAIKLVLGFLIHNLTMMPKPHPPAAEDGVPSSTVSSYDPSSGEPMNGSPNARSVAYYMAYSVYQPSSSCTTYSNSS